MNQLEVSGFPEWRKIPGNESKTFWDYNIWCGEEYKKLVDAKLEEHRQRNIDFLILNNHADTFSWVQQHMKSAPPEMSREKVGDEYFEISLTIMGCYNSLMNDLIRDELHEEAIIYFLNRIKEQKTRLDKLII